LDTILFVRALTSNLDKMAFVLYLNKAKLKIIQAKAQQCHNLALVEESEKTPS